MQVRINLDIPEGNSNMDADNRNYELKQVISEGYNSMSSRYQSWSQHTRTSERRKYTDILLNRFEQGANILDLGCGTGLPTTLLLSEKFHVTAIDISDVNIEVASQNVPNAVFIRADMTEAHFPDATFDCITAFYSLIHIDSSEQQPMYEKMFKWLRPGGIVVMTLGCDVQELHKSNWLGVPMYWGGFDNGMTVSSLQEVGFELVSIVAEVDLEDGKPIRFLWVIAAKP